MFCGCEGDEIGYGKGPGHLQFIWLQGLQEMVEFRGSDF